MTDFFSAFVPNSAQKYFIIAILIIRVLIYLHSGGTLNAFATSSRLKTLVLTPFSLDSFFRFIFGILYLKVDDKIKDRV
jgi:hypothetical protein